LWGLRKVSKERKNNMTEKMLKKALSIILIIAILVVPMNTEKVNAATGTWDAGYTAGTVTAKLTSDGTMTITGTGAMKVYNDTSLPPWYSVRDSITKVVYGEGVTTSGQYAFTNCANLVDIEFSSTVTVLSSNTFYKCSKLETVVLPNKITTGWSGVFGEIPSLRDVYISDSTAKLDADTFKNSWGVVIHGVVGSTAQTLANSKGIVFVDISTTPDVYGQWDLSATGDNSITGTLKSDGVFQVRGIGAMKNFSSSAIPWRGSAKFIRTLDIENGITHISNYFMYQAGLTVINLPDSITSIGNYSFYANINSTHVKLSNNLGIISNSAFQNNTSLVSIVIPESVTSIESYAFYGCSTLTSVRFPSSVKTIAADSFYGCVNIKDYWIEGSGTDYIYSEFFDRNSAPFAVFHGTEGSYGQTFAKTYNRLFSLVGDTEGIIKTWDASQNTDGSVTATLYNTGTLKLTGTGVIYGCAPTATTLPWYRYRSLVTSLIIEEGITGIGSASFRDMNLLTSIDIPSTVTSIGAGAFLNCTSLLNAYLYNKDTVINKTYSSSTYLPFPTTTIIHGLNSSTAKSYANVNGNVFELIEDSAPSVDLQTKTYDKQNPLDVSFSVKYGFGTLKASAVSSLKVDEVLLSSSDWSVAGTTVTIKGDVFKSLASGSNYFVTVKFDDFAETSLKNVKVSVTGTDPITGTAPSVLTQTITYDRANKKNLTFAVDLGTTPKNATEVVGVKVNTSNDMKGNWDYSNGVVTLYSDYVRGFNNGTYTVTTVFNDSANTQDKNVTLEITGPDDVPSIMPYNLMFDKYVGKELYLSMYFGSGAKKASSVTGVLLDGVLLTDYTTNGNGVNLDGKVFANTKAGIPAVLTVEFDNGYFDSVNLTIWDTNPVTPTPSPTVTPTPEPTVIPTPMPENKAPEFATGVVKVSTGSAINASIEIFPGLGDLEVNGVKEIYVDNIKISDGLWSYVGNVLTISHTFTDNLSIGKHIVEVRFNDSLEQTISSEILEVVYKEPGTTPEAPVAVAPDLDEQVLKYVGLPIVFGVKYTNDATKITNVYVNDAEIPSAIWSNEDNGLLIKDEYLSVLNNGFYSVNVKYNNGVVAKDKLFFTIPKDTSWVTPVTSTINILYVKGSSADVEIPLGSTATSVESFYLDSSLVDSSMWNFDTTRKILKIKSALLDTLLTGTHSVVVTVNHQMTVISSAKVVGNSITAGVLGASTGDMGIIISAVTTGSTGLTYHVDDKGNTVIDGYTGNDTKVTIPSDVNGSPVTGVDSVGDKVTEVVIPDTVVVIKPGAIDSGATIVGGSGSAAEEYANNNGNTFTEGGSSSNPGNGSGSNGNGNGNGGSGTENGSGSGNGNGSDSGSNGNGSNGSGSGSNSGSSNGSENDGSESAQTKETKAIVIKTGSKVKITPSAAKAKKYAVSNKAVISVDSKGIVKAKKAGTAYLYVRTEKDKVYKILVIVKANPKETTSLYSNKTVKVGDTLVLTSKFKKVVYKSNTTTIAKVSTKGVVTTLKAGAVKITVTEKDNELTYFHTINLKVIKPTSKK